MIVVVQRVESASVLLPHEAQKESEERTIGPGLLALIGIERGDTSTEATWIANKLAALRIFPDETGRMNRSVRDINADMLVVSQFTLAGALNKGTRPSFANAEDPELAAPMIEPIVERLRSEHALTVRTGVFGTHMSVSLVNDGPVTLVLTRRPAPA